MASKSNKPTGIAVVVPMYNEEEGARKCVTQVMKVINKLSIKSALIVVNDGSRDNTSKILKSLSNKFKIRIKVVEHKKNHGYGNALQTGARTANKLRLKYVLFMDSDLTNNPKYINNFAALYQNNLDCIKASRYMKGGGTRGVPLKRRIFSVIGNSLASRLFALGIHDCTNGFRMVKTNIFINIKFKEISFPIILEELYYLKRLNAKCVEIPIILTSREKSKTHFTYSPEMIWNYLKYAFKAALI